MQAKGRLRAASITQNGASITNRRLSNVAAGLPPPKPDVGSLLNAKGRLRTSSISKAAGDSTSILSPIARESLAGVAGSNNRKQSLLDGLLGRKQSIMEAPLDSARGSKTNIAPSSKSNSNSMVNLAKSGSNKSMGSRASIRDLGGVANRTLSPIASRPGSPSVRHKTVKSNSISAQGAAPVPKSKLVAKVNGSGQNSAVGSMESIPAK